MSRRTIPNPEDMPDEKSLETLGQLQSLYNRGGPPSNVRPEKKWKQPYLSQKARRDPLAKKLAAPKSIDGEEIEALPELNAKQYQFVKMILAGKSRKEAYREVYDPDCLKSDYDVTWDAFGVAKHPKVLAHLDAVRRAKFGELIAECDERQAILSTLARSKAVDFLDLSNPQEPKLNLTQEHPNIAAVRSVKVRRQYDRNGILMGMETDFQLADPIRAIDVLNRMDKVYAGDEDNRMPAQVVLNIGVPESQF